MPTECVVCRHELAGHSTLEQIHCSAKLPENRTCIKCGKLMTTMIPVATCAQCWNELDAVRQSIAGHRSWDNFS